MKTEKWSRRVVCTFRRAIISEWGIQVVAGGIQLYLIAQISQIAGKLLAQNPQWNTGDIVLLAAAILSTVLLVPLLSYMRGKITARSTLNMQTKLFEASIHQRWAAFEQIGAEQYLYRLTNDIYSFREHAFAFTSDICAKLLLLVIATVQIGMVDWTLTIISLSVAAMPIAIPFFFQGRLDNRAKKLKDGSERIFLLRNSALENRETIYINGLLKSVEQKDDQATAQYLHSYKAFHGLQKAVDQGVNLAHVLSWMALLLLCVYQMHDAADMILFVGIFEQIRAQMMGIVDVVKSIGVYRNEQRRLDEMTENVEQESESFCEKGDLALVWDRVTVAYGKKNVLQGFSGMIKSGEKVALVGKNGAGKSTFLHCVLGLTQAALGKIWLGDNDMSRLSSRQTSRLCAACLQEKLYFPGTYRENILYTPDVDPMRVQEIAEALGAEDLLDKQGELSGGERQRIELIRTLAQKDKALYLFDEPESMLDEHSKQKYIGLLAELKGIVLIASHDPDIIRACDRSIQLRAV